MQEPANDALDAAVAAAEEASDLEARLKRASQAPPVKPRDMVRAVKKHNGTAACGSSGSGPSRRSSRYRENMDLHPKKFIAAVAPPARAGRRDGRGTPAPTLPPPDAFCLPSK